MTTQSQPRPLDRLYSKKIRPKVMSLLSRLSKPKDKSLKEKLSHIGRVTEKKRKG